MKTKHLKEQEAILRKTVEKMLRRRKENEALKGAIKPDQLKDIPEVHLLIDRASQGNLESEEGH